MHLVQIELNQNLSVSVIQSKHKSPINKIALLLPWSKN